MQRVLLLVAKTSYRTDAFVAAAERLGVEALIGSDRCHVLDGVYRYPAGSLALDFRHAATAAAQIAEAARERPLDAIVPTSDATSVIAALAGGTLGLPHNPPVAAYAARNKHALRTALAAAGVRQPAFAHFTDDDDPAAIARAVARTPALGFPCVVKPLLLSASRGVIRADDEAQLAVAVERVRHLLATPELATLLREDPAGAGLLVERFVPGPEVAVEAILAAGRLRPLAIFDKPDPLDGPFFEETIYVTPSRHPEAVQRAIVDATAAAARALGLVEGPIHAELRLGGGAGSDAAPAVIEVAARTIGGLCARTLRFSLGEEPAAIGGKEPVLESLPDEAAPIGLEEIVLAQALRREAPARREASAAGVMMLPIPRGGVLRAVEGEEAARATPHVVDLTITARVGEALVPLPEGASYLGFLFARAADPATVEKALREAHARLRFDVAPLL